MASAAPPPESEADAERESASESETESEAGSAATDDGTPPAPAAPQPSTEPRFFRWIRGLGLVRRSGWLGGVCAAVAERTRLDLILVRGIVVVLAVLGAPVVLVYAAAWFLLPDEKGAIHALSLARGRVDGAVVAIAALVVASFLPLTQGFWWVGAAYWGEPDFAASAGRILWTLLVIVVAIVVVVWIARRAARPEVPTVPATTDDRPETIPAPPQQTAAFVAEPTPSVAAPPPAPTHPAAGASDAELTAWKAQQEEWKRQRAAWAAQQRADDRARRAAAQAAWAEQRNARLAEFRRREPWVGGAVIGIVFGLALIVGAGTGIAVALAVPSADAGWPAGFGAAAGVFGLGLAVAGLARRRAGALAALAVLALVASVLTVPLAADRQLVPWVGPYPIDTTHSGRYARIGGVTYLDVGPVRREPMPVVDIWQASAGVRVEVHEKAAVRVVATVHGGGDLEQWVVNAKTFSRHRGDAFRPVSVIGDVAKYDIVYGKGEPSVTLRLDVLSGSVSVENVPAPLDSESTPTPAPSFSAPVTPSPGVTP